MDDQRDDRESGRVTSHFYLRLLIWLGALGFCVQAILLYQREGAPATPRVAVFVVLGVLLVALNEAYLIFKK